jgi:hypothetical protein
MRQIGDKVWFQPSGYLIAILCTIVDVGERGNLEIDEPTENPVADDLDLFSTKEEAVEELIETHNARRAIRNEISRHFEGCDSPVDSGNFSLDDYRVGAIREMEKEFRRFSGDAQPPSSLHEWPEKSRDEWLNLNDALCIRGMPRSEFEELYGDN